LLIQLKAIGYVETGGEPMASEHKFTRAPLRQKFSN
jgi:hypothetical protein